jgi:membrane-associated PAP2 superfamily phosphatase
MSERTSKPVAPLHRHSLRSDIVALVLGLLALAAWDASGMDIVMARGWGTAAGFAWRDHWFTAGLMHGGIRMLGWGAFLILLVGVWRPLPFARLLSRRELVWWLVTTLLCVALIPLLKRASATSCPWALAEFGGGAAQYVPHWVRGLTDGGPGGCFPSGHASTAFAFLSGWFALRERNPSAARMWLLIVVAAGAALGGVQAVRGAHYVSHSLWTAWICWVTCALSFHGLKAWRAGGGTSALEPSPAFATVVRSAAVPEAVRIDKVPR